MKKNCIILALLLFCCLQANSQDYLQLANDCFDKGDYECAKRNYTFFQTLDGKDMSAQIQKADECYKTLIIADAFYTEKDFEKARDRYKTVLDKNPNDSYVKKQYDLCIKELNPSYPADSSVLQIPSKNNTDSPLPYINSSFVNYTETANNLNIEMVAVQGGDFTMGCTPEQGGVCSNNEKPQHRVTISDYYIGKYEVTQSQWKAVMGKNRSRFKGDDLPVENVTWTEVQEFIRRLNAQTGKQYRLPTEAEWEYAARGGNKSREYMYSGSNDLDRVAWYGSNSDRKTHVVGTKSANELGMHDMSGNVCEWCSDWYGNYNSDAQTNPTGASSGSYRVFRGGSYYKNEFGSRVTYRDSFIPGFRDGDLGFRLVCSSN